jgi:hypothetical protein
MQKFSRICLFYSSLVQISSSASSSDRISSIYVRRLIASYEMIDRIIISCNSIFLRLCTTEEQTELSRLNRSEHSPNLFTSSTLTILFCCIYRRTGCSFCRLISRPKHLMGRHWYLPANWRSFIRWSPDQWVGQCYASLVFCVFMTRVSQCPISLLAEHPIRSQYFKLRIIKMIPFWLCYVK